MTTKTKEIGNADANPGREKLEKAIGTEVLNAQTFNFMGTDVRVIVKDDEPWFVASDVCDVLGLQNPTKSISALDDDERSNFKLGRQGEANIISEAGMYTLALRSRKPQAKPFRRWVTHEVLPAINRTGVYIKATLPTPKKITDLDEMMIVERVSSRVLDRIDRIQNISIMKAEICGLQYRISEFERVLDTVAPAPKITIDDKGKSLVIPLELIRR